jgi:hypothetical protein
MNKVTLYLYISILQWSCQTYFSVFEVFFAAFVGLFSCLSGSQDKIASLRSLSTYADRGKTTSKTSDG